MFNDHHQESSKTCSDPPNKIKELMYKKQSAKKCRSSLLENQRYLNNMDEINWRMGYSKFLDTVANTYNSHTLLNTLFAISQEANWRDYLPHMEVLISTFHNISTQKNCSNTQNISKIPDFELQFTRLFQLKDRGLRRHLILLLKMILAYNQKYQILSNTTASEILADMHNFNELPLISETLWLMSQVEVSDRALVRLFKITHLPQALQQSIQCLLAFLSILSNFFSSPNHEIQVLEQLVSSDLFAKAFKMGVTSGQKDLINESILIINNAICLCEPLRPLLLNNQQIKQLILGLDLEEAVRFKTILSYIEENGQGQIGACSSSNNQNNCQKNYGTDENGSFSTETMDH